MTIVTQELDRIFRYNSVDLLDPGIQYTAEQVRDFYAPTYPEILNAAIEGPEEKDGKLVYTFRRAVGTKGGQKRLFVLLGGAKLIAEERDRQISKEGWTEEHDDAHDDHSLALAACAYAAPQQLFRRTRRRDQGGERYADCWPDSWLKEYDKRKFIADRPARAEEQVPETRIRCLVKAGALIAAEIDRLLRRG